VIGERTARPGRWVIQDRKERRERLANRAPLERPAPPVIRDRKVKLVSLAMPDRRAIPVPSERRDQPAQRGRLVPLAVLDPTAPPAQTDRRAPPALREWPDLRAPMALQVRPGHLARRVLKAPRDLWALRGRQPPTRSVHLGHHKASGDRSSTP
jgi:hypothetical protein